MSSARPSRRQELAIDRPSDSSASPKPRASKRPAKRPPNPYLDEGGDVEALSPANRLAYDIVSDRRDVLPSVEHIMNAGLTETETAEALTLFHAALGSVTDPNRNPRTAVAAVSPAPPAS